mmetsp:Transcript_2807/g.4006  ORF Transcript_2807/g.4006 Transcript_2807/m.4006 type:complete len:257 (+) Transcript_2807:32-802(+)
MNYLSRNFKLLFNKENACIGICKFSLLSQPRAIPSLSNRTNLRLIQISQLQRTEKNLTWAWTSRQHFTTLPPHTTISLPGITEECVGRVVAWNKAVGDQVEADDIICDVELETYGVIGVKAEESGFLAKQLLEKDGEDQPHGTPLCILVSSEEDLAAYVQAGSAKTKPLAESTKPAEESSETFVGIIKAIRQFKSQELVNEELSKKLLSLARHENSSLLNAYKGSLENDSTLDQDFFLSQCIEIADDLDKEKTLEN